MAEPAVRITNLHVVRGGRAVIPDLSLEIPRKQVTGLMGPSGCGKSTLMRAIVGSQIVASGSVSVLGQPAGSAPLRSQIGYLTQAPSVYDDLSARENLEYFCSVLGLERERVNAAIAIVGIDEEAERPTRTLSGGQRARVSLAVALLGSPPLLVLDEPTVGLDPIVRRELWATFRKLVSEGATLLVSSHVMDEAVECDSIALMREGRILAHAPPETLMSDTGADDMSEAFVRLIARDSTTPAEAGT